MRNLGTLHLQWDVSIKSIPPLVGPKNPTEEEAESIRASQDGGQAGSKTFLINTISVHMNSQGLTGLVKVCTRWYPRAKRSRCVSPSLRKYIQSTTTSFLIISSIRLSTNLSHGETLLTLSINLLSLAWPILQDVHHCA